MLWGGKRAAAHDLDELVAQAFNLCTLIAYHLPVLGDALAQPLNLARIGADIEWGNFIFETVN